MYPHVGAHMLLGLFNSTWVLDQQSIRDIIPIPGHRLLDHLLIRATRIVFARPGRAIAIAVAVGGERYSVETLKKWIRDSCVDTDRWSQRVLKTLVSSRIARASQIIASSQTELRIDGATGQCYQCRIPGDEPQTYHPPLRNLAPSIRIRFLIQLRVRQHYARPRASVAARSNLLPLPKWDCDVFARGTVPPLPKKGFIITMGLLHIERPPGAVGWEHEVVEVAHAQRGKPVDHGTACALIVPASMPGLRNEAIHVPEVAVAIYKEGQNDFCEEGIPEGRRR
ncbi:hypothetical protein DFH08DRAFT_809075 [Mycena albidolilacea]|uniref:Uncharacterized protein n=1 Tax=Mycena albidolilacea TaxID=1033008 RepID=A0AAD7A0X9_9AGAR|nr:hypothetical protein DFH08DRAFT_809075 [Mycena albidolilacea]